MTSKLTSFISIGGAALIAAASAAAIEPVPVTGKIQWVYNYSDGQKLAHETGKPLFVVFRCER